MKFNPYVNAAAATVYIGVVVSFLHYIESIRHDTPDTVLDGIGFLSLLVLSVTVMAYLFFYQPVCLFLENKKREALSVFLKTLGTFGVITVIVLALVSTQ